MLVIYCLLLYLILTSLSSCLCSCC